MAINRALRLKKILASDPSFTNVLVGVLMLFFESLWLVIYYDNKRGEIGKNFGWDLQLLAAAVIIFITVPFLLTSLFLASSMTDTARRIVFVCSLVIGVAAVVYCAGIWMEVGLHIPLSFAVSRLPFVLFGLFVFLRLPMLRTRMVQE